MATILTKRSNTASSVPVAGDLTNSTGGAELAVNTADKRLFTKDSGGTVVELGTNPSSVTLPNGTANGVPYLNGSKVLTSGSALTFDGTALGIGTSTVAATGTRLDARVTSGEAARFVLSSASSNTVTVMVGKQSATTEGLQLEYDGGTGNSALNSVYSGSSLLFKLTSSEQMRLTSTGLGIGTSSPGYKLDIYASNLPEMRIRDATVTYQCYTNTTEATMGTVGSHPLVFRTAATERARIDSSGNLQVSNLAGTGNRAVYSTSTGILTNSSSDRSLKENDEPISQGLDAVLAMRPVSFEWVDKDKMGAQREIGFIAQEMQQIVPEVVGSNSDETLSIDYPKLVAVMAKAIQELTDRVKVLEAK